MCWPFPIQRCVSIAPYYSIAFLIGGTILIASQLATLEDEQLSEGLVGIGIFVTLSAIVAGAVTNMIPDPYANFITNIATGAGYFGILVFGTVAFAAIVTIIGAVAAVLTRKLIGDYA